jgi:putative transposase
VGSVQNFRTVDQATASVCTTSHTTSPLLPQSEIETEQYLFDNWFDPIEAGLRDRTRDFLQAMFEAELRICSRARVTPGARSCRAVIRRRPPSVTGHSHGPRSLLGTVEIAVPRARLDTPAGKTTEWKSQALRAYQRRTLQRTR